MQPPILNKHKTNKNNLITKTNNNLLNQTNNNNIPILNIDPISKRSNIHEVSKQLNIFVQLNYETLGDCIKTLQLNEIIPPKKPIADDLISTLMNNPFLMLLIQTLNPVAFNRLNNMNNNSTTTLSTNNSNLNTSTNNNSRTNTRNGGRGRRRNEELASSINISTSEDEEEKSSTSENVNVLLEETNTNISSTIESPQSKTFNSNNQITINEYNIQYMHYCEELKTRNLELSRLFALILSILSPASLHITSGHPEYITADHEKNGFKLWKIVFEQHRTTQPQSHLKFQQNEIKENFYNHHQKQNQTLHDYYEEFINIIKTFKELQVNVPDEEEQALSL